MYVYVRVCARSKEKGRGHWFSHSVDSASVLAVIASPIKKGSYPAISAHKRGRRRERERGVVKKGPLFLDYRIKEKA